jgi:prevent-host-death family protein
MTLVKKKSRPNSTVGIKELKNKTSVVIDRVERTRKGILVKKNNRAVARIIPVEDSLNLRLEELEILGQRPKGKWNEMKLEPLKLSSDKAILAITKDREES